MSAPAPGGIRGRPDTRPRCSHAKPAFRLGPEAERELGKIPFFVRGKARRNTERFAEARGLALITVETLYDAKAHYGR
jgi:light-independent protochlorophyllide reductase subunit B